MIDLTEIPAGNRDGRAQDRWELFCRDFLEALNFKILEGPDRGPDGGRDLIVQERVRGEISDGAKRWLVSGKHFAHSGRSVRDDDEVDPAKRLRNFNCVGFLAFYSTLPSSGLHRTLGNLKPEFDVYVFDNGRIVNLLLGDPRLMTVFKQHFPLSFEHAGGRDEAKLLELPALSSHPLQDIPDHWRGQQIRIVRLYRDGQEPSAASLNELIEKAGAEGQSELGRGFTAIRKLLHGLSDQNVAPPIISTAGFNDDLKHCHERCHEIGLCCLVLMRIAGLGYGYMYDQDERVRIAMVLERLWQALASMQSSLDECAAVLQHVSKKIFRYGASAHQTIDLCGQHLLRVVHDAMESHDRAFDQLDGGPIGNDLPFSKEHIVDKWSDIYGKLHVSQTIDEMFDAVRTAFSELAIEAVKADEMLRRSTN